MRGGVATAGRKTTGGRVCAVLKGAYVAKLMASACNPNGHLDPSKFVPKIDSTHFNGSFLVAAGSSGSFRAEMCALLTCISLQQSFLASPKAAMEVTRLPSSRPAARCCLMLSL